MKKNQLFPLFLKILVTSLTFWIIYREITAPGAAEKWGALSRTISKNGSWLSFLLVMLLMLLNWGIEALKWAYLLRKIEHLTYLKALSSLLAGLNLAIFTPARIGEYGGRVLYLKPENRIKGSVGMLVGAFSQMLVTNVLGLTALLFFLERYVKLGPALKSLVPVLALLVITAFFLFYFHVRWFSSIVPNFPFLKRFEESLQILHLYSGAELMRILLMSLLRYFIFSNQYYFLISVLFGPAPYLPCLMGISLIFMVQSVLPTFALADIGVRGATATFFMGFILGPGSTLAVLAAAFGVWLINIILPAVCGLYFVLKLNFSLDRHL